VSTLTVLSGEKGFIGTSIKAALENSSRQYYCLGEITSQSIQNEIRSIRKFISKNKSIDKINLFHFAGITEYSRIHTNQELFINETINLITNITKLKASFDLPFTLIFPSTSKVYGSGGTCINEQAILEPKNLLGRIKLQAEEMLLENQLVNETLIIARIFNVFGKNQKLNFLIPTILSQLTNPSYKKIEIGNLKDLRDYLYLDDVVKALMILSDHSASCNKPITINIGSGKGFTAYQIAEKLLKISNISKQIVSTESNLRLNENSVEIADNSELKKIGWVQSVTMDEGLQKCIDAYNKQ
jgi:nucleoside-diphosphate-sugar epimerase